jgi:hypothetical protein
MHLIKKERGNFLVNWWPIQRGQFAYIDGATCNTTHEQVQDITILRRWRTIDNKVSEENAAKNELPPP